MKRLTFVLFVWLSITASEAQQSAFGSYPDISIDHLHQLSATEKNDTIKVRLLNNLAYGYSILQLSDSILFYANQALDLSKKTRYPKGEFESRKWQVIVMRQEGDFPNALNLALQNLRTAEEMKDTSILLLALLGVGRTYNEMNDYLNQLKYTRRSQVLVNAKFINDEKEWKYNSVYYCWTAMADAFSNLRQYDSALYYLGLAYDYGKDLNNSLQLSITANTLGKIYLDLEIGRAHV